MSGIYILKMKYGYKVAYSDRYEEMIGSFDDATGNYKLNGDVVAEVFKNKTIFLDREQAEKEAIKLSFRHSGLEDGIRYINNCQDMTYSEIIGEQQ